MEWLTMEPEQIVGIIFSSALIYIILMVFVKINGLRSFAKMSAFDFVVTIAIGSIVAQAAMMKNVSIAQASLTIGMLFLLQAIYSCWRRQRNEPHLENKPLLLMDGSKILEKNMAKAKISHGDLMSKLREANVIELSEVRAVVLEATGDVSVLHSNGEEKIADCLLKGVRR